MTDTLIPSEFKTISDTGEIEGYASTFGNRDLVGDIVQPGAFTKSLAGRSAADVLMLWGHDHKRLIGVWTEIAEDTIGLRVKGRILTETRDGAEAFAFAEEFGRLEGLAFVNGDGIKKPVGIMQDPSVPEVLNGSATDLSTDALIRLMYAMPAYYRNRGSWLLNGNSIAGIRLLKDENGRYLWQDSLTEGTPSTLLGRPVVEAVDMPDVAADAFPVIYGDFNAGFRIADRIGLSVLRDPYTQATEGLVRFHGRRRVGAGVIRPDAFRKLKMATS